MSITDLIGKPESETLEYKAVLPPARTLAQMISSFANTKGGTIVLGIVEAPGGIIVNGLSEDFRANSVTHKAIDLLSPKPEVSYKYISIENKRVYLIEISKSVVPITIEGRVYIREGSKILLKSPIEEKPKISTYTKINEFGQRLISSRKSSTEAKLKFVNHYQSVLNIVNDLPKILYPKSPLIPTDNSEGKILMRILFSSCADNFEIYLSDLLYAIYLANPSTLKSEEKITIKEVLDCSDLQEFIVYWTNKKLGKLQRGSVKGFITDNKQIGDLKVFDEKQQDYIDSILQIRHLYAHRNGIIDDKFLKFYSGNFKMNDEHQLSTEEMLGFCTYFFETVERLDKAAIKKYQLVTLD